MESNDLPWKNLSVSLKNKTVDFDLKAYKNDILTVLQNYAKFTTDPEEVIDVSLSITTEVGLLLPIFYDIIIDIIVFFFNFRQLPTW